MKLNWKLFPGGRGKCKAKQPFMGEVEDGEVCTFSGTAHCGEKYLTTA